jgi:hypothetical protein
VTAHRRVLAGLVATALLAAACGADPAPSADPSDANGSAGPSTEPAATDRPFRATAWPAGGSACETEGYAGRIGRVEATSARTVVFTLCGPDGAFLARLAHPALGVLDATAIDRLAADPSAGPAGVAALPVRAQPAFTG